MSYDDLITKKIRAIRARYYTITFLVWFSTALPLALSVLLAQARGLSLFEVGFALGVYSLTIVLLEVPTGGLADSVGRKRVALLAFVLAALYNLAFLLAFSFPALLLAMILYGVSRALSSGALDAWFVDALQAADPQVDLQPALAGAESVSLLALALGTVLGGALPRLLPGLPADGAAVVTPLAVPLVVALALKLVLVAAVALLIHDEMCIRDSLAATSAANSSSKMRTTTSMVGFSRWAAKAICKFSTSFWVHSRMARARAVPAPVSYTHLDVYKRQSLSATARPRSAPREWPPARGWPRPGCRAGRRSGRRCVVASD